MPQASLPVTRPITTPVPSRLSSGDGTRIRPRVTTTPHHEMSRQPTAKPSTAGNGTKKRKHVTKSSRPTPTFGGSDSDESSNQSGDGFSSGDTLSSDASVHQKRQKTSAITTRSSTRTHRTGVSPALAVARPSPANLDTAAPSRDPGLATPAVARPTGRPSRRSADTSEDAMDADTPPSVDPPPTSTSDARPTKTSGNAITEEPDSEDPDSAVAKSSATNDADSTVAKSPVTNDVGDPAVVETGVPTATNSTPCSLPTPTLSADIDATKVPEFLLSHGTGKRTVNIFAYLKQVTEPHFQQVLLEYLRFENRDKTKVKGTLPAAGRPVAVSQWLARARPADLPDFTKGGRTFAEFVDSALAWWASLQPSWRSFWRDRASREVKGGWGVLYCPRTNGVLSIVILVYWWAQVLETDKQQDGTRTDYESFAEDVAWVLSKLSD